MSDMVRAWLDHTQQLDQEATPGPWTNYDGTVGTTFWNEGEPDFEPISYTHIMARADAEWIAHARTALPKAAAALRAVLDLHAPIQSDTSDLRVCEECDRAVEWPCPTVKAITAALTSHYFPGVWEVGGKCDHEARGITWAEGNTTAYVCETCEHEWTQEGDPHVGS